MDSLDSSSKHYDLHDGRVCTPCPISVSSCLHPHPGFPQRTENQPGLQVCGLASGLRMSLLRKWLAEASQKGGCHAVLTVSRVDGAGQFLRYVGSQRVSELGRVAFCLLR